MEAPTKEITVSRTGAKVVLRAWITGRQAEEINLETMSAVKAHVEGKEIGFGEVDMAKLLGGKRKLLEAFVVSVNGVTEGAHDLAFDLPESDTDEVMAAINELRGEKKA